MHTMYCNFTKCNAIPSAVRVSTKPICLKKFHQSQNHQYFPTGSYPKPLKIYNSLGIRFISNGVCSKTVFWDSSFVRFRCFSSSLIDDGSTSSLISGGMRTSLPWLAAQKAKEVKREKMGARNSWEESAERLEGMKSTKVRTSSWEQSAERLEGMKSTKVRTSSWEESAERLEGMKSTKVRSSSWEESADRHVKRSDKSVDENRVKRDVWTSSANRRKNGNVESGRRFGEDEEGEGGDEFVDDPRWDRIQNRFNRMSTARGGYEKPEIRRWNKQENWGRKTFREASESSVPNMIGEGIYGVGPVLAALSAGRREFYALHVQEGLDLSSNNRKKKDKKGFEKVLRIAEKIGLSVKETSKHDLNMVVDNRPHQGLVLDASPLEMIRINKLDPVLSEDDKGSLWLALDEVTDPQNLGAIIRSAYFFGASGVVLCAKNSAPLSSVVSKASAGSLELMELRSCKNMMQFLMSSTENGWRVLGGSVSSRAVALKEISPGAPTILVLGSEGTGLRPLVERSCTHLVRIPGNIPEDLSAGGVEDSETTEMDHRSSGEEFRSFMAVESLNVSVAAGVLLHHLIGDYHSDSHLADEQIDASL